MTIVLRVTRRSPGEAEPRVDSFDLDIEPGRRLLDALLHVRDRADPTLAFRASCGHGVCGSDAMVINGRERLACKTLVRDVAAKDGDVVTIEPLVTLPTVRDLVVDQAPFFDKYRAVRPYLHADPATAGGRERLQSPEQRAVFENATRCILCAACYSVCPVVRRKEWLGPAAIVNAFRFDEDSRDHGFEDRLEALDRPDGVWPCENWFECTRVCPRGILVTKHINATKRKVAEYRAKRGEAVHDK